MVKKRNPHHKTPSHNHAAAKKPAHKHASSATPTSSTTKSSSAAKSSDTVSIPMPKNIWMIATIVLAIVVLYMAFGPSNMGSGAIGEEKAGQIVLDFAESQGLGAELREVTLESGLYKVDVEVQGQTVPVYVTIDGESLVPSVIPLSTLNAAGAGSQNPGTPTNLDMNELADDDAIKGDPNAPVTIVEFSDYECPFCEKFYAETLEQLENEYINTGKVKLIYRDFPLGSHPNAQKAAEAAECAGEQGRYYGMHDMLFENGASGGVASYKAYAQQLGLDTAAFNNCLDSGATVSYTHLTLPTR